MQYSRNVLGIILVVVTSAVGQVTVPGELFAASGDETTTAETNITDSTWYPSGDGPTDEPVTNTTITTESTAQTTETTAFTETSQEPTNSTMVTETTAQTTDTTAFTETSQQPTDSTMVTDTTAQTTETTAYTGTSQEPTDSTMVTETTAQTTDTTWDYSGEDPTTATVPDSTIITDSTAQTTDTTAFTETSLEPTDSTMVTETTAQTTDSTMVTDTTAQTTDTTAFTETSQEPTESTTIVDPTTAPIVCEPDCPDNSTCDLDHLLCKCDFGFVSVYNNDSAPCREPVCDETCIGTGQICQNESCVCDSNYELEGGVCTLVCPDCDENAACSDPAKGCECKQGYTLIETSCMDINECDGETREKCPGGPVNCVNTEGSYQCDCETGYYYDMMDEMCLEPPPTCADLECDDYSTCGSNVECVCNRGYEEDEEGRCKDIDECGEICLDATELCKNSPGSYSCDCITGYRREGNSCEQISCGTTTISCNDDQFANLCVSVDEVIVFPTTLAGYTANTNNTCQDNTANAGRPFGSRPCSLGGVWGTPTWLSECDITITEIATENITDENREETSSNLEILTSEPEELDKEDIDATTEVIVEVTSAENLTTSVADSVVTTISNLMESPSIEDTSDSSELIVQLDTVAEKVELNSTSSATRNIRNTEMVSTYTSISGDVGLLVSDNKTGFGVAVLRRPDTGKGFRSDQIVFIGEPTPAGSFIDGNRVQASIFIPGEAAATGSRSWIVVYRDSILFRRNTNASASRVESDTTVVSNEAELADSMILSASVLAEESITGLREENITFSLPVLENTDKIPVCAYWLENATDWSPDGCTVSDESTNGSLICTCNHLTNFASLFDTTSIVTAIHALDIITLVGCSISSVALIAVILVYVFCAPLSWRGKRYHASFLLVSLSVSLLGMNITLLMSQLPSLSDPTEAEFDSASCITIAIFLHLFMLSSCAWMNCEAVVFGIAVMKPFYSRNNVESKRVVLWSILWAVLMPLLFVGISAAVNIENYVYGHDGTTDEPITCWIDPSKILYLAVIPTALMIFFNLAVYIVLTYRLCTKNESELGKYWKSTRQSQKRRLMVNFTIVVNLGVSWVFGFFMAAASNPKTVKAFAYIFTISTSLQGLFILLLTVLRSDDVRNSISGRFSSVTSRFGKDTSQYYTETIRSVRSEYSNPSFTGPGNPYTRATEDENHFDVNSRRAATYRRHPHSTEGAFVIGNWRERRHSS